MKADMSWKKNLRQPAPGAHLVQVYQDSTFLAQAVCHFISSDLDDDGAVIIIAKHTHSEAFQARLKAGGIDLQSARDRGQIKFFDAELMLSAFMIDGMPDWNIFEAALSNILGDTLSRFKSIRAYGEMVDLLWQKGQREAAICLEEYWNDLAKQYDFSLLCAYFMDNLSSDFYDGALECLCKTHSHLVTQQDDSLLDVAVTEASQNILGQSLTGLLGDTSHFSHPTTVMSTAQAKLLYLSKNLPLTTQDILSHTKARYKNLEEKHIWSLLSV
ncbi:MAG TPA: MEDS domain-containing protein [Methylophilaceae bacterium]|nr:MEDS domain-containing protein [Methylophilaceae bacterium]